jgi:hypothetical protein
VSGPAGTPKHERAPLELTASPGEPPRSEALQAELAALEAILPVGSPAVVPRPAGETGAGDDQAAVPSPPPDAPPAADA